MMMDVFFQGQAQDSQLKSQRLKPVRVLVHYANEESQKPFSHQYGRNSDMQSFWLDHRVVSDDLTSASLDSGSLLSLSGLRSLAKEALGHSKKASGCRIVPASVLYFDSDNLVWFVPGAKRNVFFSESLGLPNGLLPYPDQVFHAKKSGRSTSLYVFAVNGGGEKGFRPNEGTVLCQCPAMNVWLGGEVCIGSAQAPKTVGFESMAWWESMFFDSNFSHPNAGQDRYVAYPVKKVSIKKARRQSKLQDNPAVLNPVFRLWSDLSSGKRKTFPMSCLRPLPVKTKGRSVPSVQGMRSKMDFEPLTLGAYVSALV